MTGEAFGGRLRTVRLAARLSQNGLARASGIPKSRLSRYENGHLLPSLATLTRLSQALEVSEASLLGTARPEDVFLETLLGRGLRFETSAEAEAAAHRVADQLLDRPR